MQILTRTTMPQFRSPSTFILLVVFTLISYLAVNVQVQAVFTLPQGVKVLALLAFGDSIVDPGNNNYLFTLVKCNFPPYGSDFMGGTPTGRFCNGKIPTDLIAAGLGIKELLPAYLDRTLTLSDLLTGVSFASSGAGYDPLTAKLVNAIGLHEQLNLFEEYIEKLKASVGEDITASILSNSIYTVVAGSDDIANTYFITPFRKIKYDVHAYCDLMVQYATSFVQRLYKLGARRIGVYSAPPLGCLPSQRTLQGNIQRQCADKENEASMLFNSKLSAAINQFIAKFGSAKIIYIDIYNPLLDIIRSPSLHGFQVVDKGCCGTGELEVAVLCNSLSSLTCQNVSRYLFWDSYHPTQKAYEKLVTHVMDKYFKKFFCIIAFVNI